MSIYLETVSVLMVLIYLKTLFFKFYNVFFLYLVIIHSINKIITLIETAIMTQNLVKYSYKEMDQSGLYRIRKEYQKT